MWWKTKTRPPFLCLPSTCQTTVATVTWAPCYCLPALLLPGVLFETKPSPSPLDGGDLTLHIKKRRRKARDPASCLICSHGGPLFCCIHCLKKSRHIWLWKYKFHHLLHSLTHTHTYWQTATSSSKLITVPWRGSCCFICASIPTEG